MIQPNELRIGNYIASGKEYSDNSIIGKVLEIGSEERKFEQIYCECDESFEWFFKDNYCGIPLTPDILEVAGFKYNQLTENYEVFYDCVGMLGINKYDGSFVIANDNEDMGFTGDLKSSCKYLHQLQNLIYCLTGEELQIDITKLNK